MNVDFDGERREIIARNAADPQFAELSREWLRAALKRRYVHNFNWMGRPIIQSPVDILALQEIVWKVKPDLIIETGIAHGGSLVFYASLLEAMGRGTVVGVDIEIRPHNRAAIEAHPLARRIVLVEGSSTREDVVVRVRQMAGSGNSVMVVLDSNHTHQHVLDELRAYADLVSVGSYCVVMDTIVEELPEGFFQDRPWDVGNSPKTAVEAFLAERDGFEVDGEFEAKLMISAAPGGFIKRTR